MSIASYALDAALSSLPIVGNIHVAKKWAHQQRSVYQIQGSSWLFGKTTEKINKFIETLQKKEQQEYANKIGNRRVVSLFTHLPTHFLTEERHQKAHHFNGGMNDAPK